MIFPWQADSWQQFVRYLNHKRLAHAILVSGPPAIGKLEFCLTCIQRMNCTAPNEQQYPCGACENCHLTRAGTHPDVRLVNAGEGEGSGRSEQIKVDDIREINRFMSLSRQQGRYKVVCISQADRMNINAANALLKTLEEPPSGSVLFLVSHRADSLPATMKSRCQTWKFNAPDLEPALQWLQKKADNPAWESLLAASGRRPLLAWELHSSGLGKVRTTFYEYMNGFAQGREGVAGISARLQNEDPERVVGWLQAWCGDLIRLHFEKAPDTIENPDIIQTLHGMTGQVDLQSLFRYLDRLAESRRIARAPMNRRLFIEDMLVQCQQSLQRPAS